MAIILTAAAIEQLRNTPAQPPSFPSETETFDCIDFGGNCARGYDPCRIAGKIRGIPISYLSEGPWLGNSNTGSSGSTFIFRDKTGRELGRAHKPSMHVVMDLVFKGQWPAQLVFVPTNPEAPKGTCK